MICLKKNSGKKYLKYNKNDIQYKKNEKLTPAERKIKNVSKNIKYEYIPYNGKSTELINCTIKALNTGLFYLSKSNIKEYNSNTIQTKNNHSKFENSNKKAVKSLKNMNERITKNVAKHKINLKKKLINKPSKNIKHIKIKRRNKSCIFNFNNNKKSNNTTLSIERNNEISYNSIIQNISTLDNSFKTRNINKNKIHSDFSIFKKDDERKNSIEKNSLKYNSISHKDRKQSKYLEFKEKYNKINSECNDTKNQIEKMKNENNNIKFRIENVNKKFLNIKQIRSDNFKNEMNLNKLKNNYDYSENIKMKQINLIQKISKEIKELKTKLKDS